MTGKTYADGKGTAYIYDADGRLTRRTLARRTAGGTQLTTTYSYDHAGRRTGIVYNDNLTPGITLAYDYLNRLTAVTDGAGSRTFSYNADSTLASETIPNIVNGTLAYAYDNLGRRTGLQLKQNSAAVFSNNYTYDEQSRIATVSDGANTATYTRNLELIC
jgi:YD repeat-containing protein